MYRSSFFNEEATITRQEYVDDNFTEDVEVGTCVGHLQQVDAERAEQMDLEYRKAYEFITTVDAPVKEGDRLDIEGHTYSVEGVLTVNNMQLDVNHTRVLLQS